MESMRHDIEFRQSNRSADFIQGIEEEDSDDRFINRGRMLHTLFSAIETADDIDPAIERLIFEGVIRDQEKEDTVQVTIIPLPTDKDKLEALAIQLIDDDKPLMDTILESLAHPQAFYEHKAKTVGEDEIDYEAFWIDAKNDIDTLSSVGMLYLLSDANVVRSVDPKEGLDNFLWNIECLKRVQLHHLTIEKALLNNTLDILHCCDIINKQWEPTGFQLALIDDDSSDSTITVVPIGWKGFS